MGLIKEFKEFAATGNFIDLAIGVILGGAAGKIVNALVENIIMPPIAYLLGGKSVSELFCIMDGSYYDTLDAAKKAGAPIISYGIFLQSLIDFIIIAFVLFLMLKVINKIRKKKEDAPAGPTTESLLSEIRDLLKNK